MKRFIIAGVAAATLGGGAFAFASGFTLNSNVFGSGDAPTASCQTDALTATPTIAYHAADGTHPNSTYYIDSIKVSGIDAGCVGSTPTSHLRVTLSDASNASIVELDSTALTTGNVSAGAFTFSPVLASGNEVTASVVSGIHALMTNGS